MSKRRINEGRVPIPEKLYFIIIIIDMLMLRNFALQDIVETHHTSEDRLTAMLRKRLQSSPNPTWSVVVKALRSRVINRPDIADEIEVKYIKSDDFSMQETIDTAGEYRDTKVYLC